MVDAGRLLQCRNVGDPSDGNRRSERRNWNMGHLTIPRALLAFIGSQKELFARSNTSSHDHLHNGVHNCRRGRGINDNRNEGQRCKRGELNRQALRDWRKRDLSYKVVTGSHVCQRLDVG